jgi:CheY-like chemotaxis protein
MIDKKKHTILVVEDERPLLEAIQAKLEKGDFEVVTARTVKQALDYMEDLKKIDVIWLDHYLLGKENGLDFVGRVKSEDAPWKSIPIFVVSNTASPDKVKAYLRLGVNKYYAKADSRLDGIAADIKEFIESPED